MKSDLFTARKIYDHLVAILLPKFNDADADNDQSLDMNEFADYAQILYDAIGFYTKALRDTDTTSKTFDNEKITQNEWDCTSKAITDNTCSPNAYDQTKVCLNDG